mgnify:FL=1
MINNKKEIEQILLNWIYEQKICTECQTRIRFGDIECPHCGIDLEENIHKWIILLVNKIASLNNKKIGM